MKSQENTKAGHLKDGGPLLLQPTKEGQRKGAITANRRIAERKNQPKPIVLDWARKG